MNQLQCYAAGMAGVHCGAELHAVPALQPLCHPPCQAPQQRHSWWGGCCQAAAEGLLQRLPCAAGSASVSGSSWGGTLMQTATLVDVCECPVMKSQGTHIDPVQSELPAPKRTSRRASSPL